MLGPSLIDSLTLRLRNQLERTSADRRASLARSLTAHTRKLGLIVVREAGDIDIPSTLTAEFVEPEVESRRAADAAAVLDGVITTARRIFEEPGSPLADRLFRHFGPLEAVAIEQWERAEDVTIARVDWFLGADGRHYALELNATIPAMQAYSDAAAGAWLRTFGAAAGLDDRAVTELVARNGSNAEQLRRSVLAHAKGQPSTIAIVHRAGDPQIRELEQLVSRWSAAGTETWLATPDQVELLSDGKVKVAGRVPSVLYRHIFARRVDEASDLARVMRGESALRLQNPINSHLEVKGLLGELSRRLDEEGGAGLGLSAATKAAIERVVPWTRLLCTENCHDPEGRPVALAKAVEATPERFVLKRSWDYGGKSVLIGKDVLRTEGAEGWQRRVRAALADGPGTWVVQRYVDSPLRRHLVIGPEGATTWADVWVDASTYTASGAQDVPGGGVARFATSGIVNIVGGGGVTPMIRTDVADELVSALERAT